MIIWLENELLSKYFVIYTNKIVRVNQ